MNEKALLCAAVVVAVAAGLLLSPVSPFARQAGPVDGLRGVVWSPTQPAGHQTVGGLFHPPTCGQGRTQLMRYGWGWISQPPTAAVPGLGADGG